MSEIKLRGFEGYKANGCGHIGEVHLCLASVLSPGMPKEEYKLVVAGAGDRQSLGDFVATTPPPASGKLSLLSIVPPWAIEAGACNLGPV